MSVASFWDPIRSILENRKAGLYCIPGDFYVDPHARVERAIITHGHADHARSGHEHVLATFETIEIMKVRSGKNCAKHFQSVALGETLRIGDALVSLHPAGHVLGSAQVSITYNGYRVVVSGDYKRAPDPTCLAFEPVPCNCFITEATFALPLFNLPPAEEEIGKLMRSLSLFPNTAHVIMAYSLGKAQQMIALLREQGHHQEVMVHPSVWGVCLLYERLGVPMGALRRLPEVATKEFNGVAVVPPGSLSMGFEEQFGDHRSVFASGWMHTKKGRGRGKAHLPLVISDHADWSDLLRTIRDTKAETVLVTHGSKQALKAAFSASTVNCEGLDML
ncbi:ligase-associated DNA damage response exonuclease [Pseudovibrio exalbescens]|uniref:ligase-associated DNA damage response exonuclease n=1 Tax=Pseudovibrio exalbescens TaxID=197461 RepID=UPI002365394D|nr:ligase-associated DNA damage response exonuclease [Pseudovibrio exalbescens]MDD7911121.1 ligase-associated DNA damage response exonuclease [Pseudovibrio exalbescens]